MGQDQKGDIESDPVGTDERAKRFRELDEVTLDPTSTPAPEEVTEAVEKILEAPGLLESAARAAFKDASGSQSPSASVKSAEGTVLFDGLHVNGNGQLADNARESLRKDLSGRFARDAELGPEEAAAS